MERNTITLADGRDLEYCTYGDPDGLPVIFSHGFTDSMLIRNPDGELTTSLGVRMIAANEPGVGGSSPLKDRTMVDWGSDMEQLADHLGLGKFAVAGHSGGGPHTLSVAHHLPDRVTHGALASPVGPYDEKRFAKLNVMSDLKLIVMLHHFHRLIRYAYKSEVKKAKKDIGTYLEATAKADASDKDTFYRSPEQTEMFEENFTMGVEKGEEGIYEMTMALWDWGFEIEDIKQPFDVFFGDNDDIISPQMPQLIAEELPNGTPHTWPGAGHYGFVDRDRWTEFLGALT